MDLLHAMTVFVKVVETGSMTAAALECGMSTTMVGNHLRGLEQRLGVSLLKRTTRRQGLTEFGSTYYQRCVDVLALVADSEQLAAQSQDTPQGTLRITAPFTFGSESLAPALSDFIHRYPQIKLDIVWSNERMDLIGQGFDAAIRLGPVHTSSLIARPLQDYTLTLCAAPSYLEKRGTPELPMDLQQHNCLAFAYSAGDDWSSVEKHWRLTGVDGEVLVPVSGSITMNTSTGLHKAARAGAGIAMIPDVLVQEDLDTGKLIALLPDYQLPSRPLHLLYAQDRYRSPKLRSFVDFVMERWGRTVDLPV